MNNPAETQNILQRTLQRSGGWYLVLAALLTQIVASIGAIAADYTIQVNAEFSPQHLAAFIRFSINAVLISNLVLLLVIFFRYSRLRKALNDWKNGLDEVRTERVWTQITSMSWRYTLTLLFVTILGELVPTLFFTASLPGVTPDQIVYAALGIFSGIIGTASISLLLFDFLLKPAREALLPERFEDQLRGDQGLNFGRKVQVIIFATIVTSLLLIAPIGYHQTTKALQTGMPGVLNAMRTQSLVVAFFILIYGIGLSIFFSRSLSSPINDVLDTFEKIEAGVLSSRANVSTSDEIGQLAVYFNRMISRLDTLQSSLENQITQRTDQLRATAEVGRAASSILDPDELIEEIVNLITERLGYYYAAIFIISPDGTWAELRSATGEAGAELKARKHRLSVGGKSMVGTAISLRQARIAHDVGLEAVRFNNPLLPETRSEIALPLIVGRRVLGALDAQSTKENAFDQENAETLQGMANQVAVALENARLYQEAQVALREIRTSQQTQLAQSWSELIDREGNIEFAVGQGGVLPGQEPISFNIPLSLRDQVIGEISISGDEAWTEDDEDWVSAVARQAAFAIENARLLEESQQTALQERLVAEITGKIWSSTTIDGILQVAIAELGRTLSANEAVIKLDTNE